MEPQVFVEMLQRSHIRPTLETAYSILEELNRATTPAQAARILQNAADILKKLEGLEEAAQASIGYNYEPIQLNQTIKISRGEH